MAQTALVLGGGGVAGIAWQTGLLHGLSDAGVDVTAPDWSDTVLGTSAGSTVAAQVTSGITLSDLYSRQVDPAQQIEEPRPDVAIEELNDMLERATERAAGDRQKFARYVGEAALAASTPTEADRRVVIGHRLPGREWPERDLRIVAVDAESGRHRVLDRDSGVRLVDAVAASCAIPGMWPPVTIGVHRYIDGGVRSSENADLAVGFAHVLVLQVGVFPAAPADVAADEAAVDNSIDRERAFLSSRGAVVEILSPDEASLAAIGPDPTDPRVRAAAAEAGFRQGAALAEQVRAFKAD
ncbi:patatin-like phospholipase family protein [Rhodococcus sp. G-MC3]|uniref:patatin-like phospholipase family protein n=1 Tax=Rhodococcus sp. G-MC3 TaxID=3046209 RepID=UPI0024BB1098|nr:patatin-like phospholipase family protein [Rhodococcus sp. G-MC3]MDJ0393752.1 patatin-like phospholipase family protein [Rhodococcus sp. G-MC3]